MRIHLSLGSNLGDRMANLRAAWDALDQLKGVCVTATSGCYETVPVGVTDQPVFLNAAVEIETDFEPLELLKAVKSVEHRLGRVPSERWGPRSIDIDIVLMGDRVVETQTLTVPHADFRGRAFVLLPLAEIAADAVDPVTGATVGELAKQVDAQDAVRPADVRW